MSSTVIPALSRFAGAAAAAGLLAGFACVPAGDAAIEANEANEAIEAIEAIEAPHDAGESAHAGVEPAVEAAAAATVIVGTYPVAGARVVVDGDTLRVRDLEKSLRLIGLDTEERYANARDREEAQADFIEYSEGKKGTGQLPVKYGTPMGERATEWAREFLHGVTHVRLELDDSRRKRGYYDRLLVHVFVLREEAGGAGNHFNVEAVRAGMSPYFIKYGRSARFDAEFRAAENEARAARRGIWSSETKHYPDYEARLRWWGSRADAIDRFEESFSRDSSVIRLEDDRAWEALLTAEGEIVTMFGTFRDWATKRRPFLLPLSHRVNRDVNVVCFTDEERRRFAGARHGGEYVYVRGRVSRHRGRPQMLARDVEKVWTE